MTDELITSVRNPRIMHVAALRDRRRRAAERQILIDGTRELSRAIAAGVELVELYWCENLASDATQRALVEQATRSQVPITSVSDRVFAKIAYGERTDGILGVARTPSTSLDDLRLPERPLVAVLEGVEKPGNVGAILRTADGAGVSAVIIADTTTDLFNPNTIRASMGIVFSLPVATARAADVHTWLVARGMNLVAARVDAQGDYTAVDFTAPTALVLGSEAHGLSEHWRAGVRPVRLPMRGVADSLNVSAAAAVLFYEALRQRR